ncbi:MAG: hypothetical protein H6Q42_3303 [Deltaproteobacteria bacterium]|nr:hypothetical protein [Deltaproteobacteria bacterium]
MIMRVGGLLIFGFSMLFLGLGWAGQVSEAPEKLLGAIRFLPGDDEIPGWKRSEKILRASNQEELYKIFNGGASLLKIQRIYTKIHLRSRTALRK